MRKKSIAVISALLILAVVLCVLFMQTRAQDEMSLYCEVPVYYAGELAPDASGNVKFSHVFTIENRSPRSITISKIIASCGCTEVGHEDVIAANGKMDITATVDYSASPLLRREISIALYFSDQSEEGVLHLSIVADIGNFYEVSPIFFYARNIKVGEVFEDEFFIRVTTDGDKPAVSIENIENEGYRFAAEFVDVTDQQAVKDSYGFS